MNGKPQLVPLRNKTAAEVTAELRRLRNRVGRLQATLKKWPRPRTATPSVQGPWAFQASAEPAPLISDAARVKRLPNPRPRPRS